MTDTLNERITAILPKLLEIPKAKQVAISEALEAYLEAKRQELAASRLLLRALQAEYTWWLVAGGTYPKHREWRDGAPHYVKVVGCGNLDAAMRARRKHGLRYIYEVKAHDPDPTTAGPTDG